MSVIGSIMASVGINGPTGEISDLSNPANWLMSGLTGVTTSDAGVNVGPESALRFSAYYAILRAISEDVAKLPLKLYKADSSGRGRSIKRDDPRYRLLHDTPNSEMTAMAFREMMTMWALGWGGGIAWIERSPSNDPKALWPIHPRRVEFVRRESDRAVFWKIHDEDGFNEPIAVPDEDVVHIRGFGEGPIGYSLLGVAANAIGLGLAAQRFGSAFYKNGTQIGGVLTHPKTLSETALARLRESWTARHGGSGNAGKPAILEEGMTFTPHSVNPDEAQFIETRKFQIEDLCRFGRIPPHKIQHLERATFSNIEHQAIEYVQDTLMPLFVRWEQELNRKLLFPSERGWFFEHNADALLRGDSQARAQAQKLRLESGAMSPNDIREQENMNPIEGGDVYVIPMNMEPIHRDGKAVEPDETPDPEPVAQQVPPQQPQPDERDGEDEAEETAKKAQMRVLSDAISRTLDVTINAARRGERLSRDEFAEKVAKATTPKRVADAVMPGCEALAEMIARIRGREVSPAISRATEVVGAFASGWAGWAYAGLMEAFDNDQIEGTVTAWRVSIPGSDALELTEKIADAVGGQA